MRRWLLRLLLLLAFVLFVLPFFIPLPVQGQDPATLADPDGQFVTVDGIGVYYIEAGDPEGEVLLLLHGFGGSTFSWRENIDALAEAGYRVIAFDRPGFGLSDKEFDYDYSVAAQADFTVRLMDALDIDRATLVGHSAGGGVIAQVAVRHPERVERLVLVDGAVRLNQQYNPLMGTLASFQPSARWARIAMRGLLTEERFTEILASAYGDPAFVDETVAAGYARVLQTPRWDEALLGMMRDMGDSTITDEQLGQIGVPTLLMWGGADTWVPLSNGEALRDLIPGSALKIYPDVGHLPMEEAPAEFNRDLLAFLAEHPVRAA